MRRLAGSGRVMCASPCCLRVTSGHYCFLSIKPTWPSCLTRVVSASVRLVRQDGRTRISALEAVMTVLADHVDPTAQYRPDGVLCDGLPRRAAGPRFRFTERNPTV